MTGLIVDLFAGGGGASKGIELALGRSPDIAVNHNPVAVAMHEANHPATLHYIQDVWTLQPTHATGGRPVGLLWGSPDCTHFSKAKGAAPRRDAKIRDLAWVLVKWARQVRPRVIIMENVEEFTTWGPLDAHGKIIDIQRGSTFRRFVRALQALGYRVQHRELRACDYGAPTIRKRLFLIARCDGLPIVWPRPTHGPGRAIPYRTAADIIDWSIPCPSIFDRKRPLAENTLKRIAAGIKRYVLDAAEPFIVGIDNAGAWNAAWGSGKPLSTILFGNVTGKGAPTVSPFHCEAVFHATKHGFDYMGMVTVVTDVVRENNQTYRLGWSEQCKDGTKMGFGSPEYILIFRKPQSDRTKGYADVPVAKDKSEYTRARWQTDAHAFWRSSGDRHLTADEMAGFGPDVLARVFTEQSLQGVYDHEEHVRIGEALDVRGALPATFMALAPGSHHPDVWHDVNRMRTLNGEQTQKGLANHVCPLQFDIVDRIVTRYSNPGELVFDPFAGLMTVPYRAVKLGRRGQGVELNPGYFLDGVKYLRCAEQEVTAPSLLDFCQAEEPERKAG